MFSWPSSWENREAIGKNWSVFTPWVSSWRWTSSGTQQSPVGASWRPPWSVAAGRQRRETLKIKHEKRSSDSDRFLWAGAVGETPLPGKVVILRLFRWRHLWQKKKKNPEAKIIQIRVTVSWQASALNLTPDVWEGAADGGIELTEVFSCAADRSLNDNLPHEHDQLWKGLLTLPFMQRLSVKTGLWRVTLLFSLTLLLHSDIVTSLFSSSKFEWVRQVWVIIKWLFKGAVRSFQIVLTSLDENMAQ